MQHRFILAQRPVLVKRWMHLPTAKPARLLRYMAPRRECCSPSAAFPGHSLQHFMEKCDFSTSVRKIFQKPLAFFRQACYCCIQQEQVVEHNVPSLFLCSFFFYIIYCYFLHLPSYHLPCCPPVGTKKSDGLPARAIAFSFCTLSVSLRSPAVPRFVTYGDISPRTGENLSQRGSPWQTGQGSSFC